MSWSRLFRRARPEGSMKISQLIAQLLLARKKKEGEATRRPLAGAASGRLTTRGGALSRVWRAAAESAVVLLSSQQGEYCYVRNSGERARHARGTDSRSSTRDRAPPVNRCSGLFEIARQ